jgi:putative restriction endonuclease
MSALRTEIGSGSSHSARISLRSTSGSRWTRGALAPSIPGELFLYKLKAPDHFIAGGGLFVAANAYPTSLAWAAFGEGNGVASLNELRQRIGRLGRPFRDQPFAPTRDPSIGCRILEQPFFFAREQWIPVPASWSRNLVQGRTYDTATEDGRHLWEAVMERLERTAPEPIAQVARFGTPVLIEPQLGQGAFRVAVTDAYDRRCALTSEKTLPILDAAHIQAYSARGAHQVAKGLLLRTDIHRLFDIGSRTISRTGATITPCTASRCPCRAIRGSNRHGRRWSGISPIGFLGNLEAFEYASRRCG